MPFFSFFFFAPCALALWSAPPLRLRSAWHPTVMRVYCGLVFAGAPPLFLVVFVVDLIKKNGPRFFFFFSPPALALSLALALRSRSAVFPAVVVVGVRDLVVVVGVGVFYFVCLVEGQMWSRHLCIRCVCLSQH